MNDSRQMSRVSKCPRVPSEGLAHLHRICSPEMKFAPYGCDACCSTWTEDEGMGRSLVPAFVALLRCTLLACPAPIGAASSTPTLRGAGRLLAGPWSCACFFSASDTSGDCAAL